MPQNPTWRVLVVGAGSISREFALHHFTPSATGTVVAGIVDVDEAKAEELASEVGSAQAGVEVRDAGKNRYRATPVQRGGTPVPHFTSLDTALGAAGDDACGAAAQFDMVYIGTTPKSHRSLVETSLGYGKHVLLEKPLASTKDDADAIVDADDASPNLVLAMNIGMRYNAALHEMKRRILVDKELGDTSKLHGSLKTHYAQWPREWQTQPWCAGREEGGPLREVGTHFFSALLEFAGAHDDDVKEPVAVRVRAVVDYPNEESPTVQSPCETSASGVLEFRGGSLPSGGLTIDLSVRTDAPRDLYELAIGPAGGSAEDLSSTHKRLTLFDFCSLRNDEGKTLVRNADYGRRECVRALMASANGEKTSSTAVPSIVTARQGRNAQRLLDAMIESEGEWCTVEFE